MNTNLQTERQNQITPFTYEDRAVRTVKINDEPWFIAKDVCDILGLENPTVALRNFPQNEFFALSSTEAKMIGFDHATAGINIVNEPGLYRLIFQSRKPEAEKFKTWVFSEVLPQIRQTGAYLPPSLVLMDKIFQVFFFDEDMGPQRILRLLDLTMAKSALTGEYIKAVDVAAATLRSLKKKPTGGRIHHLADKVSEIRRIVDESGTPLPRYRYAGNLYKEVLPCDGPGFPLNLPAKEAQDGRP
jgi:prophage antirepressor-like protein